MALTGYINQVRRLLHDSSAQYWSNSQLTDDINEARKQVALDTGSVRQLYNFYLSAGQESYPFMGAVASINVVGAGDSYTAAPTVSFTGGGGSGTSATVGISNGTVSSITITANGTGYTSAPTVVFTGGTAGTAATASATIMNAMGINSITTNWSNSWITLNYTYFTEFQAKARYYRQVTGQPALWTTGPAAAATGIDSFYIFQIPSQSYQCDIDAIILPNPLVDDTTVEQLQYPYTDQVQYYAAYLAKYYQQQFAEAEAFLRMYDEMWRRRQAMKYQRRIPNAYGG